ncbi:DUF1524 domain-containing protein [Blastococcus sp. SYSU DS0753]
MTMTDRSRSRPRKATRRISVLIAVTMLGAGYLSQGLSGLVFAAGLLVCLTGALGILVGRVRWMRLRSRKSAVVVTAAGMITMLVGGAVAGPTPLHGSSDAIDVPASVVPPSGEADDDPPAGVVEQPERAGVDASTGLLGDTAANDAITSAPASSALAALGSLEVKGRAPSTGYDRDLFGEPWADIDRNGCDTRNDILARDLDAETYKPGTRDCLVLTGTLAEPYSGRTIHFQRGSETSEAVQIDHVVALSDAWQKGAQSWDASRLTSFANDPLNLLAVDGPLNMQKSDGDAATWLPPNRAYRCAYVARQVAVKTSYGLWVTRAERNAIATVLDKCPDEPLPSGGLGDRDRTANSNAGATAPSPSSRSTASPTSTPPPAEGVHYQNCAAVRAAGAAPIHPGEPGWQPKFDGNQDGVGCE